MSGAPDPWDDDMPITASERSEARWFLVVSLTVLVIVLAVVP
jgi:hypothetical protein